MDMNNMTPSTTIAMQEDAMWADYLAEQAERIARIPAEEAAMWDQYHAEQQMSAWLESSEDRQEVDTTGDCEGEADDVDRFDVDHYGRFMITSTGPAHMYPVDKPIINPIYGHPADSTDIPADDSVKGKKKKKKKQQRTSKDRRYVHLVKATDRGKALGKTPGKKGKSYRQLKQEEMPLGSV